MRLLENAILAITLIWARLGLVEPSWGPVEPSCNQLVVNSCYQYSHFVVGDWMFFSLVPLSFTTHGFDGTCLLTQVAKTKRKKCPCKMQPCQFIFCAVWCFWGPIHFNLSSKKNECFGFVVNRYGIGTINKMSKTLFNPSSWSNVRKAVNEIMHIWISYYKL